MKLKCAQPSPKWSHFSHLDPGECVSCYTTTTFNKVSQTYTASVLAKTSPPTGYLCAGVACANKWSLLKTQLFSANPSPDNAIEVEEVARIMATLWELNIAKSLSILGAYLENYRTADNACNLWFRIGLLERSLAKDARRERLREYRREKREIPKLC